MRWVRWLIVGALGPASCAHQPSSDWVQSTPPGKSDAPGAPAAIVTPAQSAPGRIASVNSTARHVVITYPVGLPLPAIERHLNIYRAGLKVAEVKVSRERMDVNLIADILAGECQVGDEVRDN